MISVVIPTMWKAYHTPFLLKSLSEHSIIDEIIIIDNDISKTNKDILNLPKIVHLPQKENQFVNPSWNIGVKNAKNDRICLCNDDCVINLNFLESFEKEITSDKGLIGFAESSFLHDRNDNLDRFDELRAKGFGNSVTLKERVDPMPHICYGVCMFVHKQSYYEIPDDFKIYFGDLFVYVLNKLKYNKPNYVLENGLICTKMSSTVLNFQSQIENERKVFYDVFKRYGLE